MHFAECWLTHSWEKRVIGEVFGVTATNAFLICAHHFESEFRDVAPWKFKHMLAYDLIQNPWLAVDRVERPIISVCRLVKWKSQTRCRYCRNAKGKGKNTNWRCEACSTDKVAFGICAGVGGDCWRAHLTGASQRPRMLRDVASVSTARSESVSSRVE